MKKTVLGIAAVVIAALSMAVSLPAQTAPYGQNPYPGQPGQYAPPAPYADQPGYQQPEPYPQQPGVDEAVRKLGFLKQGRTPVRTRVLKWGAQPMRTKTPSLTCK